MTERRKEVRWNPDAPDFVPAAPGCWHVKEKHVWFDERVEFVRLEKEECEHEEWDSGNGAVA
eukprot:410453-Lingulodinium_polyedra.AAC.1